MHGLIGKLLCLLSHACPSLKTLAYYEIFNVRFYESETFYSTVPWRAMQHFFYFTVDGATPSRLQRQAVTLPTPKLLTLERVNRRIYAVHRNELDFKKNCGTIKNIKFSIKDFCESFFRQHMSFCAVIGIFGKQTFCKILHCRKECVLRHPSDHVSGIPPPPQ